MHVTKSYIPMMKKLLIKLAIGLVLDLLLAMATKKYSEAQTEGARTKWLNIIEFLGETKTTGLP